MYIQGPISATIAAGQQLTIYWNTWPIGHVGPVINYMAKCPGTSPGSCSTWKGDSGSPWFKISQDGYSNGWATDKLAQNNATAVVTIPPKIAPGEYVSRHPSFGAFSVFLRKCGVLIWVYCFLYV